MAGELTFDLAAGTDPSPTPLLDRRSKLSVAFGVPAVTQNASRHESGDDQKESNCNSLSHRHSDYCPKIDHRIRSWKPHAHSSKAIPNGPRRREQPLNITTPQLA
jgi:hypothetical protein